MEIFAWSFTKRENSTRQPSYDDGVTLTGTFKESVNIMSPVVEIGGAFDMTEAPPYNYMEIPYFKRYYFVRTWEYISGFWTAYLEVDALASWRDSIGAQEQYILRASADSDGNIVDNLYPADKRIKEYSVSGTTGILSPSAITTTGTFILGVVNSDPNLLGGVTYYALTADSLQAILNGLFTDYETWCGIDFSSSIDMDSDLWRSLFNPLQYIVSAMYIPISIGTILLPAYSTLTSFKLGYYDITDGGSAVPCQSLNSCVLNLDEIEIELPRNPQANSRGSYLNSAPYSSYTLHNSMLGDITLDDNLLGRSTKLKLTFTVDLVSGSLLTTVYNYMDSVWYKMFYKSTTLGTPISLAQIARDYLGVISGVMSSGLSLGAGIGSALTGNIGGLVGGISGTVSGIISAIESYTPSVSTSGSNGNLACVDNTFTLTSQHHYIVDEDNANLGRPLCKVGTPADYAGYLLIKNADVSLKATKAEQQMIKNYMDTGFFYQ